METIFIDTSAIYALISTKDNDHEQAVLMWDVLAISESRLITNNYILLESFALTQHRLGLDSVRNLQNYIVPILEVIWIDGKHHQSAMNRLLQSNRRNLSLVDCSAFETMDRLGISIAFTFDEHFSAEGFQIIPSSLTGR